MKTPKRYHTTPKESWSEDYIEYRHDIELSRWKRKNRIRQLKATIARQAEEIKHLRTALAIRAASEYNESIRASIEYIQKHFSMEISQPRTEMEDSFMVYKWKRPIPRWDNSIIDLHLHTFHPTGVEEYLAILERDISCDISELKTDTLPTE